MTLESLGNHCVANPDVLLPRRDVFGVSHSPNFETEANPFAHRGSMTAFHRRLGSSKITVTRSLLAAIIDFRLTFSPYVAEIRDDYPIVVASFKTYIDRMITVVRKDNGNLHLHGLNLGAHESRRFEDAEKQRAFEREYLLSRGYSWEYRTLGQETEFAGDNYQLLHAWCSRSDLVGTHNWHLKYAEEAYELAISLLKVKPQRSLKRALSYIANMHGWDVGYAYKLFAIAVGRGYLELNNQYPLHPSKPLRLLAAR